MREPYKSCPECATGYCAPKRCYCGHTSCNAYESYIDPYAQPLENARTPNTKQHAKSWAERDETTWLDR